MLLLSSAVCGQTRKCAGCGKPIIQKFLIVDDKFFHPEHFICASCRKPIEGQFNSRDGKYYHPDCYLDKHVPKCDVCAEPLIGKFYIDLYGNRYHESHDRHFKECDNCSRLISPNLTRGGKTYSDGRNICNICFENAVTSEALYRSLLTNVMNRLRGFGLKLEAVDVNIQGVNRDQLKQIAGSAYSDNMRGFSKIATETTRRGNYETSKSEYSVFVLNMIPYEYIETTIAHELMHIWLFQNTHNEHEAELEEGSCNYVAYLFAKTLNTKTAQDIVKQLENEPDPVYGDGFRKVKKVFGGRYLVEFLNFLKENDSI